MSQPWESRWEEIEKLLSQAAAGDNEAENRLFEFVRWRFQAIAAHMFCTQHDPAFSESDALQNLCVRLLDLLRQQKCSFSSARHFLAVAGKHLRWAALELLRKPPLRHLESVAGPPGEDSASRGYEPAASTSSSPDRLSAWRQFHELVDGKDVLKPEEREVFTLRWYHGLKQEEIARVMGVHKSTVKRYGKSAKEKLARHIRLEDLL